MGKFNEIPALQVIIVEFGDEFIFTFDAMDTCPVSPCYGCLVSNI